MRKISKKQIGAMGLAVMMTAQSPAMAAEIETSQTTYRPKCLFVSSGQEERPVSPESGRRKLVCRQYTRPLGVWYS